MSPAIPGSSLFVNVAGKGVESVERALSLVPRLSDLVSDAEGLVARIGAVMTVVESTIGRIDAVVAGVETTQLQAAAVVARTEAVVEEAAALTARLNPLLQDFEPGLTALQPILASITTTTDADEVDAVITMVNLLPDVVDKFQADILPVLDTLGTVAPDVRDLLDVSRELNEMLGALPGLGRVKRRIDEEQAEADRGDSYRAAEEPPAAPDRG